MIYFLRAEKQTAACSPGDIKIGTTIRLSVRLKQIAAENACLGGTTMENKVP